MRHSLNQLKSGELDGLNRINISCGLNNFPDEIFRLNETLEILELSGNNLSELPEEIVNLKKLKILFLSENKFIKFPKILFQCPNLDIIGFKSNQISIIEEDSIPLNLRWLILTDNQLESLPKSIGKCSSLQKLMLAGNRLKVLPDALSSCKNLELIRISANALELLPEFLFELPRLAWVAFSGNPCSSQKKIKHEFPEVSWKDLTIKNQLGEGASGNIFLANWNIADNKEVAVKIFKGEVTSDGFPLDEMDASVSLGFHPNLVKVLGILSNHPLSKKGLVFELISSEYKNLGNPPNFKTCTRDTFLDGLKFSIYSILQITKSIASAGFHLHSHGLMHGDLYAHNILYNENTEHVFLGDFGASSYYQDNLEVLKMIERIEVRAFGYLLDDLLARVDDKNQDFLVFNELNNLKQECMTEKVIERPSFLEINRKLKEIGGA